MRPRDSNLGRLAARVATADFFVAVLLARWRQRHHATHAVQAQALGIDIETLEKLALCRQPRAERWAEDVAVIATRFGISVEVLGGMLREVAG